jgi:hypothetical protein
MDGNELNYHNRERDLEEERHWEQSMRALLG